MANVFMACIFWASVSGDSLMLSSNFSTSLIVSSVPCSLILFVAAVVVPRYCMPSANVVQ